MPDNITLDDWMWRNKMTNVAMAKAISSDGHDVTHSTISQIRNKKARPSAKLALTIHKFVSEKVSLKDILGDDSVSDQ